MFSFPSVLTFVLGAQKNCLNETILLSTHNICFGCEIRQLIVITLIPSYIIIAFLSFQGINIQKLIEAGQFISKYLGRPSHSKVAQATKSSL